MTKNEQERHRMGQRIAALRTEARMTQRELGAKCGLQASHINRIEKGRYSVGLDTLEAIGDALGYTIDYIKRK